MKRHTYLTLYLFTAVLLYAATASTQNNTIDSLRNALQSQKDDTAKVKTLNELSMSLSNIRNFDLALQAATQALSLSVKHGYINGKGRALQLIGLYYEMQGNFIKAREKYDSALQCFAENGNKSSAADVYSSITSSYYGEQNVPEALNNIYKALKLYEAAGNKEGIAGMYLMLGSNNINEGEYETGIKNLLASLEVFNKSSDKIQIAVINSSLAQAYYNLERFSEALQCDSIALQLYNELNEVFNKGGIFINRGNIYERQGDNAFNKENGTLSKSKYAQALPEYMAALQVYEETGSKEFQCMVQMYLGSLYIKLKDLRAANAYLDKSYAYLSNLDAATKKIRGPWFENFYLALSKLDSAKGDGTKAFAHYKMHVAYRDSNATQEKSKKMQQLKLQYAFDKKETLAKAAQAKKDAASKRIRNQQYFTIAALGIVVLAVAAISLIQYRNNKHKQKANALLQQQKEKVESTLEELKSTQAQLIQSEKMASLGELTAGIAHEIQNPLNFVNNFSEVNSELIQELRQENKTGNPAEVEALAQDIEENLQKINLHGKRADAIVKGMLQHSRKNTGEKQLTDINVLADEYLRLSYHGLRAKDKSFNAMIETNFDQSISKINLVSQDIGRVFLNLFNNAFYAVHEHLKKLDAGYKPIVSVSTKKLSDKIEITVKDNGMGISKSMQDKIFQPFFTTKPTGQGTGLGLSLSYDVVKAHGGTLTVTSKEGEGAEFKILLPA